MSPSLLLLFTKDVQYFSVGHSGQPVAAKHLVVVGRVEVMAVLTHVPVSFAGIHQEESGEKWHVLFTGVTVLNRLGLRCLYGLEAQRVESAQDTINSTQLNMYFIYQLNSSTQHISEP